MAGKRHVVIFVEGDTDKLFFDRLVQYYRQESSVPIASCEVRNLHGVSRYNGKLAGKLKGQIIPAGKESARSSSTSEATGASGQGEGPSRD